MVENQLLLKPERAAERLDIGRTKLYELMATGELETVPIGRSRRIPVESLVAYVQRLRAANADARAAS